MISVVIPSYNHWELTHSLLLDVYKNFPSDTEIIVVDDCSKDKEVSTGLGWWKTSLMAKRLKVFVNEKNAGFLRTANFGVSKATNGVVILISNDVKISDNAIGEKILVALGNNADVPTLVGARLLDMNTGWNTFGSKTFPYLEGWLLGFRKDEWIKFGGFDLRYAPYDFEDVDISTTYIANSGKLVGVDLHVVHLGAQTMQYSPEREAQTKINQEKFRIKWIK